MAASHFLLLGLLVATCSVALASDPSPLQDLCVADPKGPGITIYISLSELPFFWIPSLVHFQCNTGNVSAVAIAGLSSQSPGVITIANAVFGSNPEIPDDLLAKAFQVDAKTVDMIQSKL